MLKDVLMPEIHGTQKKSYKFIPFKLCIMIVILHLRLISEQRRGSTSYSPGNIFDLLLMCQCAAVNSKHRGSLSERKKR
jgi:hypothetical protein